MAKHGGRGEVQEDPVGKEAFHHHFATVSRSITIGEDSPQMREVAHALARARQWAEAGDYLAALHAIGGLSVGLAPPAGPRAGSLTAGEVEQTLADLRRAIGSAGDRDGTAEAQALWAAAREEVVRGSWEAAMALLAEARGWLEAPR